LTNFPNGKQTQESLESGFSKTTFRETNMTLVISIVTWQSQYMNIKDVDFISNEISVKKNSQTN